MIVIPCLRNSCSEHILQLIIMLKFTIQEATTLTLTPCNPNSSFDSYGQGRTPDKLSKYVHRMMSNANNISQYLPSHILVGLIDIFRRKYMFNPPIKTPYSVTNHLIIISEINRSI